MRNLLRLIIRNHAFLLFLLLETISLVLIFNYNSFQRASFLTSSNAMAARWYKLYSSVDHYFGLAKENEYLAVENARLNSLLSSYRHTIADSISLDSSLAVQFRFIPARVINNSVNKQQNYLTLNKGRKDGIKRDMGIVSSTGIVGVVVSVSDSYSMGLSILNPRWSVSAKLKKNNYFGSVSWDGKSYRKVQLNEIPFHVDVAVGDTVVTSGYSSVFPEGILIGTVDSYRLPPGENYYVIEVSLATDLKALSHVAVIENTRSEELHLLNLEIDDESAGD